MLLECGELKTSDDTGEGVYSFLSFTARIKEQCGPEVTLAFMENQLGRLVGEDRGDATTAATAVATEATTAAATTAAATTTYRLRRGVLSAPRHT